MAHIELDTEHSKEIVIVADMTIATGGIVAETAEQPGGRASYVSREDYFTIFSQVLLYDSLGLLAHNDLAKGQLITDMKIGDIIYIDSPRGTYQKYKGEWKATKISSYQAISPNKTTSDFVDMDDPTAAAKTASQLFLEIYGIPGRTTFQTCIEAEDNPSYGRRFVGYDRVKHFFSILPMLFFEKNK